MAFRFVHTADWQIGKPFRSFDEKMAGRLEEARLGIVERLAETARAAGARHVLVAGDVYDSEGLPRLRLLQPLGRMADHGDIRWTLLPGNHDPARPGGLWQRIAALGVPANVTPLLEAVPIELEPGVTLLPSPLRGKGHSVDPTAWMDGAGTAPGTLRIGLAHGSVQDFGQDGESSVKIAPTRAKSAGLAYLALGDWHGVTRVSERVWYSGTPEPDRFPQNEPGYALVVSIEGAEAAPRVDCIATAHFIWAKHRAEISSLDDLEAEERHIAALAPNPSRLLLELELSGALPVDAHARLAGWIERQQARLAHLDADVSRLHVRATVDDLATLGEGGELRWAADLLAGIANDPEDPKRAAAEAALLRLIQIAREIEGEAAA